MRRRVSWRLGFGRVKETHATLAFALLQNRAVLANLLNQRILVSILWIVGIGGRSPRWRGVLGF